VPELAPHRSDVACLLHDVLPHGVARRVRGLMEEPDVTPLHLLRRGVGRHLEAEVLLGPPRDGIGELPADAPEVAVECVGAVDKTYTETWNIGPAKGPLQVRVRRTIFFQKAFYLFDVYGGG
jgi:hypothetical protein